MDQRVCGAIKFMNANLHRKLSPDEIARATRLSLPHLRSLFRKETGAPVSRYLKQLRLERAKHLLETTAFSVKEVAAATGMSRVSHFVRDFKAMYHVTPARYAAECRRTDWPPRSQSK
jgi:transcriptional regulator GlxA family with amidase domain